MPIPMTEPEFRHKYPSINLQLAGRPLGKIDFEPVWETPTCPRCGGKTKKAIGVDFYTGKTFYLCEKPACRYVAGWKEVRIYPNSLKAIRLIYYTETYKDGFSIWQKVGEKRLKVPEQWTKDNVKVVIATFQTLYRRGIVTREQYEHSHRICSFTREYAPIPIIKEFYLKEIDALFKKYGFDVLLSGGCEPWRYCVYDFTDAYLEQHYINSKGQRIKLLIPRQLEQKTDSWFRISVIESVENVTLYDEKGQPYTFPIGIDYPFSHYFVYSYRKNVKVLIEEAIEKLDERLAYITRPLLEQEVEEQTNTILKEIAKLYSDKIQLTVIDGHPGYNIRGEMNTYFVTPASRGVIRIYSYTVDNKLQPLKIIRLGRTNLLTLQEYIATIIMYLLKDTQGIQYLSRL